MSHAGAGGDAPWRGGLGRDRVRPARPSGPSVGPQPPRPSVLSPSSSTLAQGVSETCLSPCSVCPEFLVQQSPPPSPPPHWAPSSLPWAGQKVPRGLFLPIYVPSSSRNWGILTDNRARDVEVAGGATAGRTCSPTPGDLQGGQVSSLQGPAKVTRQGHGRSVWGTGVRPGQCDPTQRSSGGRVGPELPGARRSRSQAVHRPEPCPPPPGLPDTDLRCFPETRPSTQPDGPTEAVMGRPPVGAAPGS